MTKKDTVPGILVRSDFYDTVEQRWYDRAVVGGINTDTCFATSPDTLGIVVGLVRSRRHPVDLAVVLVDGRLVHVHPLELRTHAWKRVIP